MCIFNFVQCSGLLEAHSINTRYNNDDDDHNSNRVIQTHQIKLPTLHACQFGYLLEPNGI